MEVLIPQAARLVPVAIPLLFGFVVVVAGSTVLLFGWRASKVASSSSLGGRVSR